ncbi:radical SAM protein [Anaerotalea alkaliphila]|uniref:FeMo cofactor biosynthesis protein NifB n=1 Tax=Anaerotalea alkaliphila TaxID=2662126 RepID=A0A7X5HTR5_9FIRM|nr:radical SAM protein [Anaerotalea alkaliphila]NDL66501.1 radical SAM protein [Anaerotalea alkaliphila]
MRTLEQKTKEHPCFNAGAAHEAARIHLPVAPKCNIKCNFCNRKYDCQNESRPGVTSNVLTPVEALERYKKAKDTVPNLKVVGIAGPGDPLANITETMETIRLIGEYDPDTTFCLSTNGLKLRKFADQLIGLGVSHFTVTINGVRPETAAHIYRYATFEGVKHFGLEGAKLLLDKQWEALNHLKGKDVMTKVNTVLIKGVNDHEVEEIATWARTAGADMNNIMPLIPVEGTPFEDIGEISRQELVRVRLKCNEIMPQMMHCTQCRADAVGTLGQRCAGVAAI